MTLEIGLLLFALAVMVVLFLTERLPIDLTAFLGLVFLIFGGYVGPDEAFAGFASPAVITMLSVFIVSAALLNTGVAERVAGPIYAIARDREVPLMIAVMAIAGVLSAFMNNIAATAVLMPAVAALAARARISPSRLFLPLAFGAILGGTTTLVGTPPNILAAEMLRKAGLEPFGFFQFTPFGVPLLVLGILFMVTVGRRLLPAREPIRRDGREGEDLVQLYQVRDKLVTLHLAEDAALDGQTLGATHLGTTLRAKVLSIQRGPRRRLRPRGDTVLRGGDVLLLQTRPDEIRELLRLRDVTVQRTTFESLPAPRRGIGGVRARLVEGSELAGRTLRELAFRERFGLVVLAIRRESKLIRQGLRERRLRSGDVILALGPRRRIDALESGPDFEVEGAGFAAIAELSDQLSLLRIPVDSPLVGESLAATRIGELVGLTVGGIARGGDLLPAPSPEEILRADDHLVVVGDPGPVEMLLELGEVEIQEAPEEALESEAIQLVEAAVAPRSSLVGTTLRQIDFRNRYGLLALSIWRQGAPIHGDLADIPLALGDALLLEGPRRRIEALVGDPDFVVLIRDAVPRRTGKAPIALAGLGLMIGLVVTGWQPIHVASFTAASLLVLFGAVTMQEAYRAIEWRAIFLVAAVLPAGLAIERTGAAQLLAGGVTELAGPLGPYGILAAVIVLSSALSQGLDGAPAVVLMAPVVIETAHRMGCSPYPLMMGAALAASAAFMTPFSHKANLLVMGAGGYRSIDYLRVGTPLTLVLLALMTFAIPLLIPF